MVGASFNFIPPNLIHVKPEPPLGAGSFGLVFGATLSQHGKHPIEVGEYYHTQGGSQRAREHIIAIIVW